ncbi:MAG: MbtH family NRPS accessory protein [Chloroflexi bacterium]|nr:MAG: MbtH family NRPS accessory protein [Chloroflexota bacterium]
MAFEDDDDTTEYRVVLNDEEQYSIWPAYMTVPAGWRDAGKQGVKADCLAYVERVWTDMRPLSLRRQMQAASADGAPDSGGLS